MSSYCDIEKLRNDLVNHPNFTSRLTNFTRSSPCSLVSDSDASRLTSRECLTDSEAACYSSYKLGSAREKLDTSLMNIYQPQGSQSSTFDSNYQMTMLTGVVWAALGTTVLYYAFTKI